MVMESVWEIEKRQSTRKVKSRRQAVARGESHNRDSRTIGHNSAATTQDLRRISSPSKADRHYSRAGRRFYPDRTRRQQMSNGKSFDANEDITCNGETVPSRAGVSSSASSPKSQRHSMKYSFKKRMKSFRNFFYSAATDPRANEQDAPFLRRAASLPSIHQELGSVPASGALTVGRLSRKHLNPLDDQGSQPGRAKWLVSIGNGSLDDDTCAPEEHCTSVVDMNSNLSRTGLRNLYASDSVLYDISVPVCDVCTLSPSLDQLDAASSASVNTNKYLKAANPEWMTKANRKESNLSNNELPAQPPSPIDKKMHGKESACLERLSLSVEGNGIARRVRKRSTLTAPSLEDLLENDADLTHDGSSSKPEREALEIATARNFLEDSLEEQRVGATSEPLLQPSYQIVKESTKHSRVKEDVHPPSAGHVQIVRLKPQLITAEVAGANVNQRKPGQDSAELARLTATDTSLNGESRSRAPETVSGAMKDELSMPLPDRDPRRKLKSSYMKLKEASESAMPLTDIEIRAMIENRVFDTLRGKLYEERMVTTWCKAISNSIRDHYRMLSGSMRKIVVSTYIGAKDDLVDSVHVSVKCQCNGWTDRFFTAALESRDMYVWVTLLLVENEGILL